MMGKDLYYYWKQGVTAKFEWVQVGTSVVLTDKVDIRNGGDKVGEYVPIPSNGLFRDLAELQPSYDAVQVFANRYGLLYSSPHDVQRGHCIGYPEPQDRSGTLWRCEDLSVWAWTITEMKIASTLWQLLQERDLQGLREHTLWTDKTIQFILPNGESRNMVDLNERSATKLGWHNVDQLEQLARAYFEELINRKLNYHLFSRLVWSEGYGRFVLCQVVETLSDALWVQFAQAVDGNKRFRRCQECGNAFELHPDVARADKVYCSDACRVKAYRRRKSITQA